jgi:hypothetical protein
MHGLDVTEPGAGRAENDDLGPVRPSLEGPGDLREDADHVYPPIARFYGTLPR